MFSHFIPKPLTAGTLALVLFVAPTAYSLEFITGNEFAPFTDQKLPEGGFATELVKEVVLSMGEKPSFRFLPWKRGFQMTADGEGLATFPYSRNSEREAVAVYSNPLFTIPTKIFHHKERNIEYKSLDDLYGKTLCNPVGYVIYDKMKPALESGKIKLQEPSDMTTCARFLAIGRADFILTNTHTLRDVAQKADVWQTIAAANTAFAENNLHLVVGKNNKIGLEFLNEFNTHLDTRNNRLIWPALRGFGSLSLV